MSLSNQKNPETAQPYTAWRTCSEVVPICADEVHVFLVKLATCHDVAIELERVLSAQERAEADSFKFANDRYRYVASHGVLRTLLSRYLDRRPEQLTFSHNRFGKPFFEGNDRDLHFNMSHSGDVVLYGLARGREIGIDVEQIREDVDALAIAESFFTASEADRLRSLDTSARRLAFYRTWTRKEALVKARGVGLSMVLESVDLFADPGAGATAVGTTFDTSDTRRWTCHDLELGALYTAAVIAEGGGGPLFAWRWSHELK